jgi:hypothetical protein
MSRRHVPINRAPGISRMNESHPVTRSRLLCARHRVDMGRANPYDAHSVLITPIPSFHGGIGQHGASMGVTAGHHREGGSPVANNSYPRETALSAFLTPPPIFHQLARPESNPSSSRGDHWETPTPRLNEQRRLQVPMAKFEMRACVDGGSDRFRPWPWPWP